MIRPKTPRRGAERTMRVLKSIDEALGDGVRVEIFGCHSEDPLFKKLERDFSFVNHGELTRPEVANVLQKSACFIDLSDYQAFGRTGLEAMACNCFCVTTKFGGVSEYAECGFNAIIVDPFDESKVVVSVLSVLDDARAIAELKINSLITASSFSSHKAAISEFSVFLNN
jgi:glycosyltransferase involved in cell wall biosynthesis